MLDTTYSILIVESDVGYAQYTKGILEKAFNNINVYTIQKPDDGHELLEQTSLMLLNYYKLSKT